MLRLCALNSIAPKLRPSNEGLIAYTRNWFSDGYRTSAPGTNVCRQDSDCEGSEICKAGYCAGLQRKYSTYGLYYGDEYKNVLANDYDPHNLPSGNIGIINRPIAHAHRHKDTYSTDINFNYDNSY